MAGMELGECLLDVSEAQNCDPMEKIQEDGGILRSTRNVQNSHTDAIFSSAIVISKTVLNLPTAPTDL